jgi:hypothetical protein
VLIMTKSLAALALLAALVLGLSACDGGSSEGGGKVPEPLDTIEAQAEDIIDIVPAGKWDKVGDDVATVVEAWGTYRARALKDGADQALVDRFDAALVDLGASAEAREPEETMQAANDLSAPTVEFYGLYDTGRPVDIGRLDVIGRQIVLEADRQDAAAAGVQVDKAQSIWDGSLKADILDHDGKDVAGKTDASLAALQRARAAGDFVALRTQANEFLEIVDDMERLY